MTPTEEYILYSATLHEQFSLAMRVMEGLISNASRALTIAELMEYTGYPARDLRKVCADLCKASLLKRDTLVVGSWRLTRHPGQITLEDIFQSITAAACKPPSKSEKRVVPDRVCGDHVGVFLMQATLTINQGARKQLRQFSLDRLKSTPYLSTRRFSSSNFEPD